MNRLNRVLAHLHQKLIIFAVNSLPEQALHPVLTMLCAESQANYFGGPTRQSR
jgi:hypothetical protein